MESSRGLSLCKGWGTSGTAGTSSLCREPRLATTEAYSSAPGGGAAAGLQGRHAFLLPTRAGREAPTRTPKLPFRTSDVRAGGKGGPQSGSCSCLRCGPAYSMEHCRQSCAGLWSDKYHGVGPERWISARSLTLFGLYQRACAGRALVVQSRWVRRAGLPPFVTHPWAPAGLGEWAGMGWPTRAGRRWDQKPPAWAVKGGSAALHARNMSHLMVCR